MGSNKTSGSSKGRKKVRQRAVRRILILCEDEKSSRDYFARFPHNPAQVLIECVGTGMNTDSLMEDAIRRKSKALEEREPYERIWVVYDKDDFSDHQFNRAFQLALSHNEVVAPWSNECFELWYLLHFGYRDTAIGRKAICESVGEHLGKDYAKNDASVYDRLLDRIEVALRNAQRLEVENGAGEARRNPSTRVHHLVQALRNLDPGETES
jgi:hypothetical protein